MEEAAETTSGVFEYEMADGGGVNDKKEEAFFSIVGSNEIGPLEFVKN